MGERGQILIRENDKDAPVYLYTHWGGDQLKPTLQKALARKQRWDDIEYLRRIVFDEMTADSHGSETGHGIGTSEHGDLNYPLLIVQTDEQMVYEVGGKNWSFEKFIKEEFE
jgi:hypothetical protein